MAAASARWPACSAMRRGMAWQMRRGAGGPPGPWGGPGPPAPGARPVGKPPRLVDPLGRDVPVARGQGLPLEGEQPVALEISEGPVVAEHVEAIHRALEGPARLVTPVLG